MALVGEYDIKRYRKPLFLLVWLVALIALACWKAQVDLGALVSNFGKGIEQIGRHLPPDLSVLGRMLREAGITVCMALAATPLGALMALACGLAAAKNLSPEPLRSTARFLISTERAMPEIVVLLFFIVAFNIGYFAGIMALAIGCIGMLGRLLGDAIEEIEFKTLESVEMVGATKWQVIRYAVIPETLPMFVANSIFRFEINIRNSVLLGAVGAGGLGYELSAAMDLNEFNEATTAILMIVGLVFLCERVSDRLRKVILKQGAALA